MSKKLDKHALAPLPPSPMHMVEVAFRTALQPPINVLMAARGELRAQLTYTEGLLRTYLTHYEQLTSKIEAFDLAVARLKEQ